MTASAGTRWRSPAAAALLLAAVGYNFVLAIVNANLFAIGPGAAYVAEMAIYAGCFVIGMKTLGRQGITLMLTGLGLVLTVNLLRFLTIWEIDPKFIRDAIIPFAFLALGSAYRGSLLKLVMGLALIVALVAGLEMAAPEAYGDLVNPRSYFVNTRGASEEDFWNQESKLYVSATRPGERNWLAEMGMARASSIFIEPVTMGNFAIFLCAIAVTFRRSMGVAGQVAALLLVVFLLFACDGRLATATCALMLLLAPLLRRFDQTLAFLIFILVLLGGWLTVWVAGIGAYEDTLLGRVFFSVDSIAHLSPQSWLGLDFGTPYKYFDSGIAYFIASQSILVVLAFLIAYSFLLRLPTSHGQLFKNLFVLAFALSLLVSNGYFSVKTAALWWFACGYLWRVQALRAGIAGGHRTGVVPQAAIGVRHAGGTA